MPYKSFRLFSNIFIKKYAIISIYMIFLINEIKVFEKGIIRTEYDIKSISCKRYK